jgi:hypothetical protein
MFGRKKKQDGKGDEQFGMVVPDASTAQRSGMTFTEGGASLDEFRDVVPGLMDELRRTGGHTVTRTTVSTSLTQDGHAVDPNSPQGQQLMAMLDRMGIDVGRIAQQAGPAAAQYTQQQYPSAPGSVPPAGQWGPPPAFPQPGPTARPATPPIDQGAVAAALSQAQTDPRKLPDVVALVDEYVHGRIGYDEFEARRRAIIGY